MAWQDDFLKGAGPRNDQPRATLGLYISPQNPIGVPPRLAWGSVFTAAVASDPRAQGPPNNSASHIARAEQETTVARCRTVGAAEWKAHRQPNPDGDPGSRSSVARVETRRMTCK